MNQFKEDIKNQVRDIINDREYNIGQIQYINKYPFSHPSPSNENRIIVDLDEFDIQKCSQEEKRIICFINRKKGR